MTLGGTGPALPTSGPAAKRATPPPQALLHKEATSCYQQASAPAPGQEEPLPFCLHQGFLSQQPTRPDPKLGILLCFPPSPVSCRRQGCCRLAPAAEDHTRCLHWTGRLCMGPHLVVGHKSRRLVRHTSWVGLSYPSW